MRTENLSGNIIYKIMYCTSEVAICVSYVMSDHGLNCICPFLLLVLIVLIVALNVKRMVLVICRKVL